MATDLELLEAWADGDHGAADTLFRRHMDDVIRFFSSKTTHDVEDLVHETFVRCLARRADLAQMSSFRAYLFAVARNLLYERQRKLRPAVDFEQVSLRDLGPTPSAVMARREQERLLVEALQAIPLDAQTLMELFYWEGLTLAELAEVWTVPIGTIKSRLHRGREQLRRAMARLEHDPERIEATLTGLETARERDTGEPT